MRRMVLLILLTAIMVSSLTACYDAKEIDEWAYVYTIGVDKGISNRLRMTVQISTMKGSNGASMTGDKNSQQSSDFTIMTLDCPTFYAGVNMLNTALSRKINYMHAKFFIVSEDLAKEDIAPLMSAFVRDRQIRRTMHMIIVKGKSKDFIESLNPVVGTALSKTQEGMMNMEEVTGFFDDTSFGDFIDDIKSTKKQPVGILAALNGFSNYIEDGVDTDAFKSSGDYYAGELPRKGGNHNEYLGAALFNGGKMIGELDGDETRCLLMVSGEFLNGSFAIQDPSNPKFIDTLSVKQQKKPEIKVTFDEDKPVIDVKVFLEGDLQALQTTVEYESPELKPILEKAFGKYINNLMDKTVAKCQSLNCDAFGFGETACTQFATIQDWEAYGWLDHFDEAKINTEVSFVIRRTGTLMRTSPTRTSED